MQHKEKEPENMKENFKNMEESVRQSKYYQQDLQDKIENGKEAIFKEIIT